MKIARVILIVVSFWLLIGCDTPQTPAEETSVAATAVKETQEVTYTKEMLASYHTRTYYLRPGENLREVAEWISNLERMPYSYEIIVQVLIEKNPGNIVYDANGLANFKNSDLLAPVQIPEAPYMPSNLELGIRNPREDDLTHKVVSGDTLYSLAQVYGFSHYTEFAKAVGITNPDTYVLNVGEVLCWPVEEPAQFLGWPQETN